MNQPTLRLLACTIALAATVPVRGAETADPGSEKLSLRERAYTGDQPAPEEKPWIDQMKEPTKWFSWGADERLRIEYFDNAITLNGNRAGHEWDFFRYRTRVWADLHPCQEFEVGARLAWEGRQWQEPNSKPEWTWGQLFFDNLFTKLKLTSIPLTITAGRQDIILGDGWLVLEGTPLDGSTSIYFDAVRASLDLKDAKTKLDAIFIQQYSSPDIWLPTISDTDVAQIEQNERGAILYASNTAIKNLQIDGYFIYKHDEKVLANGDNGDIYTFGTRVAPKFTDNLSGRVEFAGQLGEKNDRPLLAWGLNSRLTYAFNDPYKNQLYLAYENLSGSTPGSGTDGAFDPLWGRWPQWSELYVYTYATETRIAQTTNLQRIGPGYTIKPTAPMDITLTYNALFANENTKRGTVGFSDHGNFRGQLFTSVLKYKFNEHVSTHLWAEYLIPGNYYDTTRQEDAVYLRAEMILSF